MQKLPADLRKELQFHPIPNPILQTDGKKYKSFEAIWKSEESKKPPVLPLSKNSKQKNKALHLGFQIGTGLIRGSVICSKCSKPRLVFSQYRISGNGQRDLDEKLNG